MSGRWATPDTIRRIARRAEELGYASLWTFQRVLSPVGGALGPSHRSVLDPVVPLAHVAGHTDRIRLGTATICAPFTAPALLAKTLTSLDVLSGGRLTAGLGMGWLPEEYAAAGVPYERRGERMDEYLRCLEALWTQDPVEFAGEFYTVPRSHVGPPPVQRPHPPVLLGGAAAPALRRAGRLAQGWICSSRQDLTDLGASIETVRDGAREAGRDPEAVQIVVRGVVDLVDDDPGRAAPTAPGDAGAGARRSRGAARAGRHGGLPGPQPLARVPDVEPGGARVRGARARGVRAYAASTFGMISSLRRLRSSSVLATGTSANGGHRSGIVSPASL